MRVERVVAKVFKVRQDELREQSSRDEVKGWDSMGHLMLILGLEEEFGVSVSVADAMEMVSVVKIKEVLRTYGVDC